MVSDLITAYAYWMERLHNLPFCACCCVLDELCCHMTLTEYDSGWQCLAVSWGPYHPIMRIFFVLCFEFLHSLQILYDFFFIFKSLPVCSLYPSHRHSLNSLPCSAWTLQNISSELYLSQFTEIKLEEWVKCMSPIDNDHSLCIRQAVMFLLLFKHWFVDAHTEIKISNQTGAISHCTSTLCTCIRMDGEFDTPFNFRSTLTSLHHNPSHVRIWTDVPSLICVLMFIICRNVPM